MNMHNHYNYVHVAMRKFVHGSMVVLTATLLFLQFSDPSLPGTRFLSLEKNWLQDDMKSG